MCVAHGVANADRIETPMRIDSAPWQAIAIGT
jgi:hypothetical protein